MRLVSGDITRQYAPHDIHCKDNISMKHLANKHSYCKTSMCWDRKELQEKGGRAKLLHSPTSASLDPTSLHHRRCDHNCTRYLTIENVQTQCVRTHITKE
jgi:hypothetical protein